jgi:protein tyrosine kinase modulator
MEEEITLDLRDVFGILRKRVKLILIITIISTLVSGIVSFFVIKPTYEAGTSIVIGKNVKNSTEGYNSSDVVMYQKLMKTYAEIAKTNDVAVDAVKSMNNDMSEKEIEKAALALQKSAKVTPQADTQILDIKVQSQDPKEAKKKIDALTNSFMNVAPKMYPDGQIKIMDTAKVPTQPIKPNKKLNVAIAFLLGLMISVGLSFLLEYMDNTIKTQEDIEKLLEVPVIGNIPNYEA